MSVNGALGECAHFSFKNVPCYTHVGASAKFSTNSHETDYSVLRSGRATSTKYLRWFSTCRLAFSHTNSNEFFAQKTVAQFTGNASFVWTFLEILSQFRRFRSFKHTSSSRIDVRRQITYYEISMYSIRNRLRVHYVHYMVLHNYGCIVYAARISTSTFTNNVWFSKNILIPGTYFKNMVKQYLHTSIRHLTLRAYRFETHI